MGHRRSNVARNRWAVGLLDIDADARVLEIGCGPGVGIAALAQRVTEGLIVAVDHSPVMLRQARRRNAAAVTSGRVQLICASVEELLFDHRDGRGALEVPPASPFDLPFDAVLAINNVGFWPEPEVCLIGFRHLMHRGGEIALVTQPRCPGSTEATSRSAANELAGLLERAGFAEIETSMLDLDPPVAFVRATKPHDGPLRT